MLDFEVFSQQLITGLSNGMIIALIAIGYTMVYGIIELINFAHGDVFMLGAFLALTLLGALGMEAWGPSGQVFGVALMLIGSAVFCGGLNWSLDRLAYRALRARIEAFLALPLAAIHPVVEGAGQDHGLEAATQRLGVQFGVPRADGLAVIVQHADQPEGMVALVECVQRALRGKT